MNIHCATFESLTKEDIEAWSEIQRAEPLLASPYFRPEFTQAVAAVRNDVEVAVLKDGTRAIGFLPFQRSWSNVGHPVGGNLSDFQGLIAPRFIDCDPLELLRSCGLSAWHFDHLLSEQRFFSPFVRREVKSPYVDLSGGFDAYYARHKIGRGITHRCGRKIRKLAREIGPLRFEAHVADRALVSTLLDWKSDQYRRTRLPNILDYCWVRNLIDKILEYNSYDFSAFVSVVRAGNKIAAIHFAMRSREVLHGWFPAYNVELARYSPGLLHWIETMKAAHSLRINRIEFGKGQEAYKYRLMSGVTKVAEGAVDGRQLAAACRRKIWSVRDLVQSSPVASPARILLQNVHRVKHWFKAKIANQTKRI